MDPEAPGLTGKLSTCVIMLPQLINDCSALVTFPLIDQATQSVQNLINQHKLTVSARV